MWVALIYKWHESACFFSFQMQNLTNIVLFPVEGVLKNELRGSKGDLKRPFDRAWRDYHDKYSELERAKKKQAKEAGMIRSELTAGEIAEDLEKERKYLQIATADYLIKANEIKTKKGTELLQHLLDYYRAQTRSDSGSRIGSKWYMLYRRVTFFDFLDAVLLDFTIFVV